VSFESSSTSLLSSTGMTGWDSVNAFPSELEIVCIGWIIKKPSPFLPSKFSSTLEFLPLMGSSWFLILTRASCWFHSVDYVLQLHITGPNRPFNSIEMIFKPELIWRENQSNCSNFLSIAGTWSSNWWTEAISPSICLRIQFRWPWKFWMLAWAAETCSAIAIVFIVIIMKFKISMCLQCQRVFVSICFG